MIASLVPMTLALVVAASPDGPVEPARSLAGPACARAAAAAASCPAPSIDQGTQQQKPGQKDPEKRDPDEKRKGTGEQDRTHRERPPGIAGWRFDSPSQSPSYEGEPLRNRGLRSLPPISDEHFAAGDVTVLRELGLVIAGAEPRMVYVSSVLPSGIGTQIDIRPNDVIMTLNGQPIETTQAFQARFGRLRQGSPVELGLRRGNRRLTIAFYKPSDRSTTRPVIPNDRAGVILPD